MGGAVDEGFSDLLARLYAGVGPVGAGEAEPWRGFLEALARWMEASFATHDFKEGVASFVERRAPAFTGK